jgi:crotonobetainyl-CoA:carnitine CoA-transferase CaiB-like acyl-CoA transferase
MLRYEGYVADEPRGYGALGTGPLNRFYQASDRWFFLALPEKDAEKLAAVSGLALSGLSGTKLESLLEETFPGEPAATWVQRLCDAGIAAQAVAPVAELMQDENVKRRGLSVSRDVEGAGETTAPGLSVHFSRTPMRLGEPHRPGSDAAAILQRIGMGDRLAKLEQAWVLQVNDLPPAW